MRNTVGGEERYSLKIESRNYAEECEHMNEFKKKVGESTLVAGKGKTRPKEDEGGKRGYKGGGEIGYKGGKADVPARGWGEYHGQRTGEYRGQRADDREDIERKRQREANKPCNDYFGKGCGWGRHCRFSHDPGR